MAVRVQNDVEQRRYDAGAGLYIHVFHCVRARKLLLLKNRNSVQL